MEPLKCVASVCRLSIRGFGRVYFQNPFMALADGVGWRSSEPWLVFPQQPRPTRRHLLTSYGGVPMRIKAGGINTVRAKLASGKISTYYYHRATGTRLSGAPGSPEFLSNYALAEQQVRTRNSGTLSNLIRDFENTK